MAFTEEETARHLGEIEELFWSKRRPPLHLWECDLILIDYGDPSRNVYEVTEEWAFHNGQVGAREDVVYLINGIQVLVLERKHATKDEGIALGIDQIRPYHDETSELMVQ